MAVRDDEEENVALAAKGKKGKSRKGHHPIVEEREKANRKRKRERRKTCPKSNVGHVRRWGIMQLHAQKRKTRKTERMLQRQQR